MDALRPLSLDQFAAMTAEMEAGFPRDRVLGDATVSAEQWELTQETWLLRMAKQGSQRKLALLDRYNELLAKHRKSAQRKMRAEKRKLKGPMPVAPEAHLSPLARVRTEDGAGATFQRPGIPEPTAPSWLSQAAAAAAPLAPGMIAPVMPGAASAPSMVAMPSAFAAPSIVTAPPRLAEDIDDTEDGGEGPTMFVLPEENVHKDTGPAWLKEKRPPSPLSSTARLDEGMPKLPVVGPAWLAGAPAARPEEARPVAAAAPAGPAVPAAGPSWRSSSAAMPFVAPQAQVPAPAAASAPVVASGPVAASAPAAAPARRPVKGGTLIDRNASDFLPPAAPAGPAWIAQTAQPAARNAAPRASAGAPDALPFQRAAAPATPAAPPAIPAPVRTAPAPIPAAPPAIPAPVHAAPAPTPAAPPAVHAAPAPTPGAGPRLTIEQLAWLQAQVETSPELGRAAREKLGLGEPEYTAERAFWQARFQQDRGSVERYSQLFYHYKRGR